MNRQKFRKAYESVRPDEEAQDRMLNHILLEASEIAPAGKNETDDAGGCHCAGGCNDRNRIRRGGNLQLVPKLF